MTAMPQHMQALAAANEIRSTIAQFRRDVRAAGTVTGAHMVAEVIENDHSHWIYGTAKVGHLLLAIPALGEGKTYKALIAAGVPSGDKRLRHLTDRQRYALVIQIEMWADAWKQNRARTERYPR